MKRSLLIGMAALTLGAFSVPASAGHSHASISVHLGYGAGYEAPWRWASPWHFERYRSDYTWCPTHVIYHYGRGHRGYSYAPRYGYGRHGHHRHRGHHHRHRHHPGRGHHHGRHRGGHVVAFDRDRRGYRGYDDRRYRDRYDDWYDYDDDDDQGDRRRRGRRYDD